MEVGNMLRLKEGFEYKSLARRQDTKLEKLIAEHELLKKVAQEEINNLQRQLAQSKNSEAVRNTEIINLRKMLEHEVCQKETLEREISILQIQPLQTNLDADEVTSGDTPYSSAATFEDLNLSLELLKGLYVEMKFQKPSKIQAISLPMILTPPYKDLIAQAHNGSGKATCFVLGMLSRVDPNLKRTQALCICPTRELTIQNLDVLRKMGKYTGITSESALPMESGDARSKIRAPIFAQIVIGTPGTIKRLMSLKKLSVTEMKVLVFDEADHMLAKDGFQDDSLKIMKDIERGNARCQVLLFSATFDETVKKFVARTVKNDHNQLFVKKEELSLNSVKQYKVTCLDEVAKILVVKEKILEFGQKMGQAIIFVNSKRSAAMLHETLTVIGYEVTTIHGALNTEDRDKIVKEFKDGLTQVLISTDLLARGFDQQQVNVVVNYDLPVKFENPSEPNYEVYLHRIGRAGRFGRKGAVFSFVMDYSDQMIMDKIDQYFGMKTIEVPPSNSEEDFKVAMKAAGLM
ncbi:DEAD-box ATP-dependent RNA helicase 38-like isoform X1 [Euphorbia lathyris]|uniref:DEAD-box ATP-dependent RNA helicase 38-like isoform X1 n=1 Tax=Euphorbia lathyris TaxID=212925 RepID=UPI0033134AE4